MRHHFKVTRVVMGYAPPHEADLTVLDQEPLELTYNYAAAKLVAKRDQEALLAQKTGRGRKPVAKDGTVAPEVMERLHSGAVSFHYEIDGITDQGRMALDAFEQARIALYGLGMGEL